MRDQLVQNAKRVGLHDQLMMVCPEVLRHASRVLELVEFSLVEPDGEGLAPGAGRLGSGQSPVRSGIDAAIAPGEQMSRWQLVDATEDRTVPGRVQKREI